MLIIGFMGIVEYGIVHGAGGKPLIEGGGGTTVF
jgi:hypothetical protein